MFEQFSVYPEVTWMVTTRIQGTGLGHKIQIGPDLENFELERVVDLRKQHATKSLPSSKLILAGSNKTNIFIDGPDYLINILVAKLPCYIGKSWSEINRIKLERSFLNCNNFLIDKHCNPWIIDKFELKEIEPGKEISYFNTKDLVKIDTICANCSHFEPKPNSS